MMSTEGRTVIKLPIDWGKFELCHRCFAEPGEPCHVVEPGQPEGKEMKLPHYRRTFTHNSVKVSIPFTSEAVTAESFRQARELPSRLSSMRS